MDDELLKWADSLKPATTPKGDKRADALRKAAETLGVDAADLGAIISFESGGSFDPHRVGGEGNKYKGLIQFGIPEQKSYYNPKDTFETQVQNGVVRYFQDRFKKAGRDTRGASLEDLYTTVIAGSPTANRNAKDAFGTSAKSGTQKILKEHRPNVLKQFFGGQDTRVPNVDIDAVWKDANELLGQSPDDVWAGIETEIAPKPVTESLETIQAQIASAADPKVKTRYGVLTTDVSQDQVFGNTDGFAMFATPQGNLWVNVEKAKKQLKLKSPKEIGDFIAKNPNALTRILGIAENVGNATADKHAVTARDPQTDVELASAAVTTPDKVVEQTKSYAEQFPGATIETTTTDDVAQRRAEQPIDFNKPVEEPTDERWKLPGVPRLPNRTQAELQAEYDAAKRRNPAITVDEFNNINRTLHQQDDDWQEVDRVVNAAKAGRSIEDDYAVDREFDKWATERGLPKNQASADRFNTERKAKREAEFLAKNPEIAELTKLGLSIDDAIKEYNIAQKASVEGANAQNKKDFDAVNADYQQRVNEYNSKLPKQRQQSVAQSATPQPKVAEKSVEAVFDYNPNATGSYADQDLNATAKQVAAQTGVDEKIVRAFLKQKSYNRNESESQREEQAKQGMPQRRIIDANAISQLKAYAEQSKGRQAEADLAFKTYQENGYDDVMSDIAVQRDLGNLTQEEATAKVEAYKQLIERNGGTFTEKGRAGKEADDKSSPYSFDPRYGVAGVLGFKGVRDFFLGDGSVDADTVEKGVQADIKKYGSVEDALKAYKKQDDEVRFSREAGTGGTFAEAAKTVGRYVAKLPATVGELGAVALDLNPLISSIMDTESTRKSIMSATKQYRDAIDADLALGQNPAYKADFVANQLADTVAQLGTQAILTPLTGGASLALPIAEAGTSQYREADEKGADQRTRLGAFAIGGILAVPQVLLQAKYFKGLTPPKMQAFFDNVKNGIISRLGGKVAKEEAEIIAQNTVLGMAKQMGKNGVVNIPTEYIQERGEDFGNDLYAKATYDPNLKWKDIFVPSSEKVKGYMAAGIGGGFGAVSQTVIERMSNTELAKAEDVLPELFTEFKVSEAKKDAIRERIKAERERRVNLPKDAQIQAEVSPQPAQVAEKLDVPDAEVAVDAEVVEPAITEPSAKKGGQPVKSEDVPLINETKPVSPIRQRARKAADELFGVEAETAELAKVENALPKKLAPDETLTVIDKPDVGMQFGRINLRTGEISDLQDISKADTKAYLAQEWDKHLAAQRPAIIRKMKKVIASGRAITAASNLYKDDPELKAKFEEMALSPMFIERERELWQNVKSDHAREWMKRVNDASGRTLDNVIDVTPKPQPAPPETQGKEPTTDRAKWFKNLDTLLTGKDPEYKNRSKAQDIMRRAVEHSDASEQDIADILDRAVQMHEQIKKDEGASFFGSNLFYDIAKSPRASAETKARAQAVYDEMYPPLSEQSRAEIDRDQKARVIEQIEAENAQLLQDSNGKPKGATKQQIVNNERYLAQAKKEYTALAKRAAITARKAERADAARERVAARKAKVTPTVKAKQEATIEGAKAIAIPRSRVKKYAYADEVADQIATPEFKEMEAKSATERPSPRTGFTKTQTEYIAKTLEQYAKDYPQDAKYAGEGVTQEEASRKASGFRFGGRTEIIESEMFAVPDDGVIRITDLQQANRLYKKITGKPLDAKLPKETVRIPSDRTDYDRVMARPSLQGKPNPKALAQLQAEEDTPLRSTPERYDDIVSDRGIVDYDRAKDVAGRVRKGSLEIKRLDPSGEQGRVAGGQRAIEATIILAGNETASEKSGSRIHPVKRQERLLEEYAKREGIWFAPQNFTNIIGKGVEALVYEADGDSVHKIVNYKQINPRATPLDFIDNRIALFNNLFPATPYELVGFVRDAKGDFRFVVKQPFIRDAVFSTPTERQAYMEGKGLTMTDKYGEEFANEIYHVRDLHGKNALKMADGTIVAIDAVPTARNVQPLEIVEADRALRSTPAMPFDVEKEWKKWRRTNITYRGVAEENATENGRGAMLGAGLYTAPSSNRSMTREYGKMKLVANARPKNPKVFDSLNRWEIWAQGNLFNRFSKDEFPDVRAFNANTTIEAEMQKMGYDGIEIKGREIVNFAPPDNVVYFDNERQARQYFDAVIAPDINDNSVLRSTPDPVEVEVARQMAAVKEVRNADGKLLAPNGKVSNLNEFQWKQVRTPEFKEWAGENWDNVVKDENGEPLVVYHGTPTGGFDTFEQKGRRDSGWMGKAFYFTESKSIGETFKAKSDDIKRATKRQLYEVYLSAKNPLKIKDLPSLTESEVKKALNLMREENGKEPISNAKWLAVWFDLQHPVMANNDIKLARHWQNFLELPKLAQILGYDSLYGDMEGGTWAVFASNQIKSATDNIGTFDPNDDSILRSTPTQPFYSRVESVVRDKMPNRATPAQITALLAKSGVKELDPEMQAIKVWLDGQDGTVSKDAVLEFVDANKVVVGEVVKGERDWQGNDLIASGERVATLIDNEDGTWSYESDLSDSTAVFDSKSDAKRAAELETLDDPYASAGVSFAQFQLPGESENYREEFLTAPVEAIKGGDFDYLDFAKSVIKEGKPKAVAIQELIDDNGMSKEQATNAVDGLLDADPDKKQSAMNFIRAIGQATYADKANATRWKDGHDSYSDIVNPIARVRYNDRVTTDGDKMLFAEEIQQPSKENLAKMPKVYQKFGEEMAIRKMLYRAVEGGYDYFGFTTGQQQADRYNLAKTVDYINWNDFGMPDRKSVSIKAKDETLIRIVVNPEGIIQKAQPSHNVPQEWEGKHLAEAVGKEIAPRILESKEGKLEGDGLKVGGSGLASRYDRKHVDYINKLMKPYGVRVEKISLDTGDAFTSPYVITGSSPDPDLDIDGFYINKKTVAGDVGKEVAGPFEDEIDAERELERLNNEADMVNGQVHAVRISPEFRKAVEASMAGNGGAFPLFKLRNADDLADLEKLAQAKDFRPIMTALQTSVLEDANGANILSLDNNETSELFRTALAIYEDTNRDDVKVFDGLYLNKDQTQGMLDTLEGMRDAAVEKKLDTKALDAVIANFEEATRANGRVRLETFENARRHETIHQQSDIGSDGKDYKSRYANANEIANSPAFKKFHEALDKLQGKSTVGVALEEALAYLGDGDFARFGLTQDEAKSILKQLIIGYSEANGLESLSAFDHTELYEEIESFRKSQSSEVGNDTRSGVDSGREARPRPAGQETRRDAGGKGEEARDAKKSGERLRSLPGTLREAGVDAVDEAYNVFGNQDAIEAANNLIADLGLEKAIKTLEASTTYDKTHAVMSFMLQRALRNEATIAAQNGAVEYAQKLRERGLELASRHAQLATQAGQFAQAAAMVADAVESVIYRAEKIAQKRGKPLTPVEYETFEKLGVQVENQSTDLTRLRKDIRNLKAQIKRLQDAKPRIVGTRVNKKAIAKAQSTLPDMAALIKQIKEGLRDADTALRMISGAGTRLLAPNGKPSNLNERQWTQVRTPEFKNFFGDWENDPKNASQVVDSNGEPLVVYHGTRKGGFTEFSTDEIGSRTKWTKGIHFTDQKSVAATYSGERYDTFQPQPETWQEAGIVINETAPDSDGYTYFEVILPDGEVYSRDNETIEDATELAEEAFDQTREDIATNYAVFLNLRPPVMDIDLRSGSWSDAVYWSENEQQFYTQDDYGNTGYEQGEMPADAEYQYDNINDLVRQARNMEDAGVIVRNVYDDGSKMGSQYSGGDSTQYIVFNPNQIKSAEHNRGTFDTNDDSILRSTPDITRERLIQYGAAMMLDKPLSEISRERFADDIRKTFGNKVDDMLPQLFGESFNLRQEMLIKAKNELATESLKAEFPDKSDAEIKAELKKREDERKERRDKGTLAKKLARLYDPTVSKQKQDVIDVVNDIADPVVADYAEKIITNEVRPIVRADRKLYTDAMTAIRDAHKILRDEELVRKQTLVGSAKALRDLEREEFLKRDEKRTTEKALARAYRRLDENPLTFYGKELLKILGESRSILASGDLSGSLRQGFYSSVTNPLMNLKGSENLPSSYGTMIKAITNKESFADRIKSIEDHQDFDIMKQMGVEFAEAGGGVAEENIRTEYLKAVPVVKNWLNLSERTYAGFLDVQRALWAESVINELRAENISFRDNPEVYKAAGALINVATGRGNIGRGKLKAAIEAFGGVFFAPRFVVSRAQLLGHVFGGMATLPPGLRKIEAKRAARFHTAISLPMLALIAAGIVSVDPDDDDFLKIRVGDKARYEVTGGLQQYIKLIAQLGMTVKNVIAGDQTLKAGTKTAVNKGYYFGVKKLAPVPSYINAALTGKEPDTTEFNWLAGIGKRLTPITVREVGGAAVEDGVVGAALTLPTLFGIGVGYYQDKMKKAGSVDAMLNGPEVKRMTTDDLVTLLKEDYETPADKRKVEMVLKKKALKARHAGTLTQKEVDNIKKVLPDFNITANDTKKK